MLISKPKSDLMFPNKLLVLIVPADYTVLFNAQVKDTDTIIILLCQFFPQLTRSVISNV